MIKNFGFGIYSIITCVADLANIFSFILFRRSQFKSSKEENCQNLGDFLVQRIGGASYYSERKGFPALIHRHAAFDLSEAATERWLLHMNETLDEMKDDIADEYRKQLSDFLRYTAIYLMIAQKSQKIMENLGPGS